MNSDKVIFVSRSMLLNWQDVASGTGRIGATDLEILIDDLIDVLDEDGTVYIMASEDYRDG